MTEIALTTLGVALPSACAFVTVRRWFGPVPWRMGVVLLALTYLFIARGVFTPNIRLTCPSLLDEIVRGYPYRGFFGDVKSKNFLTNDTVKVILPWMQTVREARFFRLVEVEDASVDVKRIVNVSLPLLDFLNIR